MVSRRARVYFPAPAGPERISEWGKRPAAMAVRSDSTAAVLPMNSLKSTGSVERAVTDGPGMMIRPLELGRGGSNRIVWGFGIPDYPELGDSPIRGGVYDYR
jgi:hypothetical protein